MTLTARETEALSFIARTGGGLPGGRQNTMTTQRLARKGMVRYTGTLAVVAVTLQGEAFLAAQASA